MQIEKIIDGQIWDQALATIPNAHVLQSWAWGEIKRRHGWTPTRLLVRDHDKSIAAAQILQRSLPRSPFGVMYVPKGPAYDLGDSATFDFALTALENEARRQRAIFVKVDPDIPLAHPDARFLRRRGWRVSPEQIQYRNSVVLNLAPSEDELLAAMKPKWRYNIRLAERKGVRVEQGGASDLETFYERYAETGARDGFLIRQYPYYRDVWSTMLEAREAQLLLARLGAETIAGLILFRFGARAWYFYGASRSSHRDVMPNHLLQWEAIRRAKAQGCRAYDFWGAPDVLEEHAPMFGVYKFKLGFGGEFVERIPAHDFVVNRFLYWAYAVVRPRYLARLRRRATIGD